MPANDKTPPESDKASRITGLKLEHTPESLGRLIIPPPMAGLHLVSDSVI